MFETCWRDRISHGRFEVRRVDIELRVYQYIANSKEKKGVSLQNKCGVCQGIMFHNARFRLYICNLIFNST